MRYVLTAIMVGTLGFFIGRAEAASGGNYILQASGIRAIEEVAETLTRVEDVIHYSSFSSEACKPGLEILGLLPDVKRLDHFQMYDDLDNAVKTIKETCENTATARPAIR